MSASNSHTHAEEAAFLDLMNRLLAKHILVVNGESIHGYSTEQMGMAFKAGLNAGLNTALRSETVAQHNSELVGLLEAAEICDKMAADEFKTQQYDRTDKAMYACHKKIMERFSALKKAAPQVARETGRNAALDASPSAIPAGAAPAARSCVVGAREWLLRGGGGHEDGEDGLRALSVSGEGLVDFLEAYGEYLRHDER